MIYHQTNDSNLPNHQFGNRVKDSFSENLPWISEGTAPDESHDIPSKPPKEVPIDQPQEIKPTPQELTQYHSADDQANIE